MRDNPGFVGLEVYAICGGGGGSIDKKNKIRYRPLEEALLGEGT